jgi:hypothetical protein
MAIEKREMVLVGHGGIPTLIRFGTSTWTYEGWRGQVYKRPAQERQL